MGYALFIGNGLNRLDSDFYSWEKLLTTAGLDDEYIDTNIPNTISFEMLTKQKFSSTNRTRKIDETIKASKEEIAKLLSQFKLLEDGLKTLDIRVKIFHELRPEVVLTTNYDYLLEEGYKTFLRDKSRDAKLLKYTSENKYNLRRFNKINDVKFFHIHGELDKPESIVLGYEHYVGTVENMRKRKNSAENTDVTQVFKRDKNLDKITSNNEEDYDFWMNTFFTMDVHIIGLSLGFEEIDLWWLIVYRSYLIDIGKLKKTTKVYYYSVRNKENEDLKKALERFNIEYVGIDHDEQGDYRNTYEQIIQSIKTMYPEKML